MKPIRVRTFAPDIHRLSNLTLFEKKVVAAAAAGELVDCGEGPFNLAEMRAWGKDRMVRAKLLRFLLVEADSVSAKGIQLRGTKIKGHLDLESATTRRPLRLEGCYLDGPRPTFRFATVPLLELKHCHLAGLDAESLVACTDLDLSGSTFTGPIQLEGAAVAGQLNCSGATLKGKDDSCDALIADGLKVGGDLVMNKGFTADGALYLVGADITGQLNCSGAELAGTEPDGSAIIADTITVGGGVLLREGFTADGSVRFPFADITGPFDCSGAKLTGKDHHGNALHAEGMRVAGYVSLDNLRTGARAGAIKMPGAVIAGEFRCKAAKLHGKDNDGNTLIAFRMKVGTDAGFDGVSTKDGAIKLQGADITAQLSFRGAQLNGQDKENNALYADSVKVGGRLLIDEGFIAAGTVRLPGANITGRLRCRRAELNGKDEHGRALLADEMTVGGGANFVRVHTTRGAISMVGADIQGDLRCDGARLQGVDDGGNSLVANSVKVRGDLIIYDRFTSTGTVRLPGANITGRVRWGGVKLKLKGKDVAGTALLADDMTVGGGAWFAGVRTKRGAISLVGADIADDLQFEGVRLKGVDVRGRALVADRITVSGSAFLRSGNPTYGKSGSIAEGTVSLRSAHVRGWLELKPEKLAEGKDPDGKQRVALDLAGARIAHDLVWRPAQAVLGEVILEDARVGQLNDNLALDPNGRWPSACDGLLRLDSFSYNRICEQPGVTLERRLEWIGSPRKRAKLNKQRVFTTQPYQQLATVYRQAGQDTEARKVSIARRRDLRRYGELTTYRKLGNWLLDNSIRYGYRTWRAIAALAVLYVAAFVIFSIAQHHGNALIPILASTPFHPFPTAMHCTGNYPCFYPAAYAIDTVIPIINVHQATYWGPNGHATWGHALIIFTWVSTVLGWILATLAVAGYTGIVRRD